MTRSHCFDARFRAGTFLLLAYLGACGFLPAALAAEPKAKPPGASRTERTAQKPKTADADADKKEDAPPAAETGEHPFSQRYKAPSLDGGTAWINTAGPIDLRQLRGKFVILDFWTYCCINCMHILPELKKLEHAYPNEIVVIGVHSAKFENEQDSDNIKEAVLRYEIEHPVVNDAQHKIWDKFEVNSWPTLLVIDPEGSVVARNSGEVEFDVLDRFFSRVIPYYRAKKLLDETPLRFELASFSAPTTPLRFPGKVLTDEKSDRLFIADSNHNRIVITKLDGTLLEVIGSGRIGEADGGYSRATFDHPQGMALVGEALYVADTENHLIRKVDLKKKQVITVAGTGMQGHGWPGMEGSSGKFRLTGPALKTALNSPWALYHHKNELLIAMAGAHQIWRMSLVKPEIGPFAGNGREDIVDGGHLPPKPYETGFSSFAQPSGLTSDGKVLYVADSEGSSIRAVPFDLSMDVSTVVGTSWMPMGRLFAFGDVDGEGQKVRLQHALDVLYHDGSLYVADTYNNKIKKINPQQGSSQTLVGTLKPGATDDPPAFDEPAGLAYAKGKLYVADTNNHAIRTIDLKNSNRVATLEIAGLKAPELPQVEATKPSFAGAAEVELEPARLKPVDGKLRLEVDLELPNGYKINTAAPLRYLIESSRPQGPVVREVLGKLTRLENPSKSFAIELPAAAEGGNEKLTVSLAYYYCQEGSEGLCKAGSVTWAVPIELSNDAAAATSVRLPYKVPGG